MKSEWKITSQYIGEKKIHQVYRKLDVNATDHNGNREYIDGAFYDKAEAESLAKELNKEVLNDKTPHYKV